MVSLRFKETMSDSFVKGRLLNTKTKEGGMNRGTPSFLAFLRIKEVH